MKAIVLNKKGKPKVLKVTDIPQPEITKSTDVLIKTRYAGVNYADLLSRQGLYSWAPKTPYVMGLEVGGEVVAVGNKVTDFQIGDRVILGTQKGGYAEYIKADQAFVLHAPKHLNWQEVASFGVNWFTAWVAMQEMARVRKGERALIHAAAGGVGTAAVQLGVAVGLEVFGTASTVEKQAVITSLGGTALQYETFDTTLRESRKQPHYILETIGGDVFKRSLEVLAPMGRLVSIGASGIQVNKLNPLSIIRAIKQIPKVKMSQVLRSSKGFMGVHIGYLLSQPNLLRDSWNEMITLVEKNNLRPIVDQVFPLTKAADAHQYIHDRRNIGKILLDPSK